MTESDKTYLELLAANRDDPTVYWRAWCLAVKVQIRPRLMASAASEADPGAYLEAEMDTLTPEQIVALYTLPSKPLGCALA